MAARKRALSTAEVVSNNPVGRPVARTAPQSNAGFVTTQIVDQMPPPRVDLPGTSGPIPGGGDTLAGLPTFSVSDFTRQRGFGMQGTGQDATQVPYEYWDLTPEARARANQIDPHLGASFQSVFDPHSGRAQIIGSNNAQWDVDPQTGQLRSVIVKTGEQEGRRIYFERRGDQYVPVREATEHWNTKGDFLDDYGGFLMLGGALGAALGGVGAGAVTAPTTAASESLALTSLPAGASSAFPIAGPAAGAASEATLLGGAGTTVSAGGAAKAGGGVLSTIADWAKNNPQLAATVAQGAVGAIGAATAPQPPDLGGGAGGTSANDIAAQQMQLAREQWLWQKQQDEKYGALYEQLINDALQQSQESRARANEIWKVWQEEYLPLERRTIADAMNFDNPAEIARREGIAAATIGNQFDIAADMQRRDLARAGVSPSSGRGTSTELANARALGTGSAINQERTNAQTIAMALRDNAVKTGRGLSSTGLASDLAALQSGAAASGTIGQQTQHRVTGLGPVLAGLNSALGASNSNAAIQQQNFQNRQQQHANWTGVLSALAGGLARYWSDEAVKRDRKPVDTAKVLKIIKTMPVDEWRYVDGVADGGKEKHIGPMAQDLKKLGASDGRTVDVISAIGVSFAANKELAKRIEKLEERLAA